MPQGIACQYVGDESDGTLVYQFYYGTTPKPRLLLRFTRSAAVLPGPTPSRLAINDFQGSTEADCYVYLDANHPYRRLWVSRAWAAVRPSLPRQFAKTVDHSDHTYFTCRRWAGGRVRVEASYRYSGEPVTDGTAAHGVSTLTGTAWLAMDGRLESIAYTPD